jgi:hypothetical protein
MDWERAKDGNGIAADYQENIDPVTFGIMLINEW